jgi:hypothetical protein
MAAIEYVIQALALLNVLYLIAAVMPKKLADESDGLFLVVFTSIQSLVLVLLAAKYGLMLYVWVGVGVLLALFAYGAVVAERPKTN